MFTAAYFCFAAAAICFAQAAPQSDVLILVDGEKLIGHLESADATSVMFKSGIVGEVKIDWAKITELQSSGKFALAKKGETFGRHTDPAKIPQGTIAVADQKITVGEAASPAVVLPVADTENVIPQTAFMNAFKHPKLSDYWRGSASAGFALVESTQKNKTLTSALNLVRTVPDESWISPRYRTNFDFESAYGTSTSAGTTIKTNIIHAGLEQDEYLNKKLFVFGDASFDHNFSQGLKLQYVVGGGIGYVAFKDAQQELDFKAQLAYISQIFSAGNTTHLIGAVIGETYNRSLLRGITFHQELSVTPSFNIPSDYSANFLANVGIPISKRFNVTAGLLDSFLNNPPPSFKKNSFQFVTNLTYKIN